MLRQGNPARPKPQNLLNLLSPVRSNIRWRSKLSRFSEDNKQKITQNKKNNIRSGNSKVKWIYKVFFLAFGLSVFFSFVSENLIKKFNLVVSILLLLIIILAGILFDIIGIAVTSASEKPFHAMAAEKIPGGKEAVQLIRNADIVSNFCNDVIGDISGIISGATGATIVMKILGSSALNEKRGLILSILMSGFISTLTIGGKALGKVVAINNSKNVVYSVALFLNFLQKKFNIRVFSK